MPTRWRSVRIAALLSCSSGLPSTLSVPWLNTSNPLMHRNSVLLPEPLLPMIAITSPGATLRSMPLSTSFAPKLLRNPAISTMPFSTMPMQLALQ